MSLEPETHRILRVGFEVYKEKDCGFVEPVYQECLELMNYLRATGLKVGRLINFSH